MKPGHAFEYYREWLSFWDAILYVGIGLCIFGFFVCTLGILCPGGTIFLIGICLAPLGSGKEGEYRHICYGYNQWMWCKKSCQGAKNHNCEGYSRRCGGGYNSYNS